MCVYIYKFTPQREQTAPVANFFSFRTRRKYIYILFGPGTFARYDDDVITRVRKQTKKKCTIRTTTTLHRLARSDDDGV